MINDLDTGGPVSEQRSRLGIGHALMLPLALLGLLTRLLYRGLLVGLRVASAILLRGLMVPVLVAAAAGDSLLRLIKTPPVRARPAGERSVRPHRINLQMIKATMHQWLRNSVAAIHRRCEALPPRTALFVICAIVVWVPLSAAISLSMHAVLLAKAASLPPWMQLLHPVATVIAKSKILVLAAYLAAWPQASKHPWMQVLVLRLRRTASLLRLRTFAQLYAETESAVSEAGAACANHAAGAKRRFPGAIRRARRLRPDAP